MMLRMTMMTMMMMIILGQVRRSCCGSCRIPGNRPPQVDALTIITIITIIVIIIMIIITIIICT